MKRSASRDLLGDALDCAASCIDAAALDAYRLDYASYRLGAMRGAKGEQPLATDDKAAMIQRELDVYEVVGHRARVAALGPGAPPSGRARRPASVRWTLDARWSKWS